MDIAIVILFVLVCVVFIFVGYCYFLEIEEMDEFHSEIDKELKFQEIPVHRIFKKRGLK